MTEIHNALRFGAGWTNRLPHPTERWAARLFDGLVLSLPLWFALSALATIWTPSSANLFGGTDPGARVFQILVGAVIDIPVYALFVGVWGVTPGKLMFGVRVSWANGGSIGWSAALVRELRVWVFGLGLGIPLVSLLTLLNSRNELNNTGYTQWDREGGTVVTHRPKGARHDISIAVGIAAIVLGYMASFAASLMASRP